MADILTLQRALSGEPPEVWLPRCVLLRRLPVVGGFFRWMSRVLPPRRWTGRPMSYVEWMPFREEFDRLSAEARAAQEPGAKVADDFDARWVDASVRFIRTLRLPARRILSLTGPDLRRVTAELFTYQLLAQGPRDELRAVLAPKKKMTPEHSPGVDAG